MLGQAAWNNRREFVTCIAHGLRWLMNRMSCVIALAAVAISCRTIVSKLQDAVHVNYTDRTALQAVAAACGFTLDFALLCVYAMCAWEMRLWGGNLSYSDWFSELRLRLYMCLKRVSDSCVEFSAGSLLEELRNGGTVPVPDVKSVGQISEEKQRTIFDDICANRHVKAVFVHVGSRIALAVLFLLLILAGTPCSSQPTGMDNPVIYAFLWAAASGYMCSLLRVSAVVQKDVFRSLCAHVDHLREGMEIYIIDNKTTDALQRLQKCQKLIMILGEFARFNSSPACVATYRVFYVCQGMILQGFLFALVYIFQSESCSLDGFLPGLAVWLSNFALLANAVFVLDAYATMSSDWLRAAACFHSMVGHHPEAGTVVRVEALTSYLQDRKSHFTFMINGALAADHATFFTKISGLAAISLSFFSAIRPYLL